jgi:hypothetical protein
MSEEFIPDTSETRTPPASSNAPSESSPRREPIKVLIIGSPQGVNNTIHTLYKRGFAEVTEWSPLQPTSNPGEVMSVLRRQIRIQ